MFNDDIRGLTLKRPWPFAFTIENNPKRVENRSWAPPKGTDWLALHSGKGWDGIGAHFVRGLLTGKDLMNFSDFQHQSYVFAVCRIDRVIGLLNQYQSPPENLPQWASQGTRFEGIPVGQQQWAFGPFVWVLKDMVILKEPVACKGGQGLWKVSKRPGLLDELKQAYKESTTC